MSSVLQDPTFWVFVSFVIFFLLVGKPLGKFISAALDKRSEEIKLELEQAVKLREEAQKVLAEYRKKEKDSLAEAERIIEQTKADAKMMADKAEADLTESLEKRKAIAMNKIARAENKAIQSVQEHVVDIAISAAKKLIVDQVESGDGDDLIKLAATDIERKIH